MLAVVRPSEAVAAAPLPPPPLMETVTGALNS